MTFKIAVVLCLFSLARASNLYGGSGPGYLSSLGYGASLSHGSALGHGASLGYGSRYSSGHGYSSLGHSSGLGYSSLSHGSSLGLGSNGYGGYGASAYSRPAISSVSINKYLGPATPYSTGLSPNGPYGPAISSAYGNHRAYAPSISGGYGYGAYSAPHSYTPAISNGHGYTGYEYGSDAYGNKW